jgi:hypothetical protein
VRIHRKRPQLRGEDQSTLHGVDVEGLDTHAIATDDQALTARIPDGKGEHPVQVLGEVFGIVQVRRQDHLPVTAGQETATGALKISSQLCVVVDLAIEDHVDVVVSIRDRLIRSGDIDDRQTDGTDSAGPA